MDIANGITSAADEGVDVINTSFGANEPSQTVRTAASYALTRGVVMVAAGGNAGPTGVVRYPAGYPGVLGISAVGENGTLASFSTRGPHIDLSGPGTDIVSTTPGGGHRRA